VQQLTNRVGKQLEVLIFSGDRQQVENRGKGFGEGEIIRYVFENSKLIQQCGSFYKITGRVFVSNFDAIHEAHLKSTKVFDYPVPGYGRYAKRMIAHLFTNSRHCRGTVHTIFYKCDSTFFKERLLNRNELVNDSERFYLEQSYFLPLIKTGFSTFKIKPVLVGFSGSTGELYQDTDYPETTQQRAAVILAAMGKK